MIMLLDDAFRVNSWTHTFHSILSEAICTAWTRRCMHAYDIDRDTKQGPSSTQPCSVCMNCNYLWSRIECSWHGSDSFFFSPSKRKFICCDCIVFDCAPEQRAKRQENEWKREREKEECVRKTKRNLDARSCQLARELRLQTQHDQKISNVRPRNVSMANGRLCECAQINWIYFNAYWIYVALWSRLWFCEYIPFDVHLQHSASASPFLAVCCRTATLHCRTASISIESFFASHNTIFLFLVSFAKRIGDAILPIRAD